MDTGFPFWCKNFREPFLKHYKYQQKVLEIERSTNDFEELNESNKHVEASDIGNKTGVISRIPILHVANILV